ncbi:hypothetical protein G6F63_015266 [Rhizopus arrhizus]|nr:hypothetical protein G6F63_015266 [Rhizopus arrhizus]
MPLPWRAGKPPHPLPKESPDEVHRCPSPARAPCAAAGVAGTGPAQWLWPRAGVVYRRCAAGQCRPDPVPGRQPPAGRAAQRGGHRRCQCQPAAAGPCGLG